MQRIALLGLVLFGAPIPAESSPPQPSDPIARRGEAYYQLMEARLALADNRFDEVARRIDSALALEPDAPALRGEGAMLLALAYRRTDAERLAREALAADPDEPSALRVLADLAAARSFGPAADPEARLEAIRLYERLAVSDERAPHEIWAVLSRLKMGAGDAEGAVDAARKFLSLRSGEAGAVRLLAQTLEAVGRRGEALDALLDWVRKHPEEDGLFEWIAEWARDTGRWDAVERALSEVLAQRPDAVTARALRGEARLRLERAGEAVDDLELAAVDSPEVVLVRFHLATAYAAANRLADAVEAAGRLAADLPDNPAVRSLLGDALARQGNVSGAVAAYRAGLAAVRGADPESVARRDDFRRRIAGLHLGAKAIDEASGVLAELEAPLSPPSLEARAELAVSQNDAELARELAERLRRAGARGSALLFEGEAALLDGRPDRARQRFQAAASELGPAARVAAALAFRRAGEERAGEAILREWVKAEPASAIARFRLGGYLERVGRFEDAEAELRESLRLDPERTETLNYLGYSLADRNVRLEEALSLIRRALRGDPWNGAYLDSLGWALFRLGRFEEARDPLERAARELPHDPTILDHLGDLYAAIGETDRARDAWRRALEARPEDPDAIREKLETLRR